MLHNTSININVRTWDIIGDTSLAIRYGFKFDLVSYTIYSYL